MHAGNDKCSEVGPIISIWVGGSHKKCLSNVRVTDSMRVWFGLKNFLVPFGLILKLKPRDLFLILLSFSLE